jgi:toxin ParE1/3/4
VAERGRILRTPAARRDVLAIADYIAADNPDAALRFVKGVRDGERALLEMPGMGASRAYRNPALHGTRMALVPDFRAYLIFYRPIADGIEIVRILHGARDLAAIFGEGD